MVSHSFDINLIQNDFKLPVVYEVRFSFIASYAWYIPYDCWQLDLLKSTTYMHIWCLMLRGTRICKSRLVYELIANVIRVCCKCGNAVDNHRDNLYISWFNNSSHRKMLIAYISIPFTLLHITSDDCLIISTNLYIIHIVYTKSNILNLCTKVE